MRVRLCEYIQMGVVPISSLFVSGVLVLRRFPELRVCEVDECAEPLRRLLRLFLDRPR